MVSGTYSVSGTTSSGCMLTSNGLAFTVAILPLNFTNLSASQTATSQVQVNWLTANEINVQQFVIERSNNGSSFSKIGTVTAVGSGSYGFLDNNIGNASPQLYYRIKAIDKDGSISYSQVVRVQLGTSNVRFSVYPNPVKDQLQIQIQSLAKHTASLKMTNVQGKVVWQQTVYLQAGNNYVSLATSSLAKGSYVLTIAGEQVYRQTIVKE
jgi:fibronectin type 3 domain-containing protein